MSFTTEVKNELAACEIAKTCCRKAYIYGLLYNSVRAAKGFELTVNNAVAASETVRLLKNVMHTEPEETEYVRAGRKTFRIAFISKSFSAASDLLDNNPEAVISDAVGFRCHDCFRTFLRGVFLSCAGVNDPHKGYHLEFALARENITRASKLYRFMSDEGFIPHISNRENFCGLYFKSNQNISDILYFIGAVKSSFDFANVCIERDIRNNENRATNCVATNIMKSVGASQRQISAIKKLADAHKLEALSDELRQTAELRIQNMDATLSELAELHDPPITKSGLNHRLKKICDAAESLLK